MRGGVASVASKMRIQNVTGRPRRGGEGDRKAARRAPSPSSPPQRRNSFPKIKILLTKKTPLKERWAPHVPPHQRLIFLSAAAIGGAIKPAAIASHGPAPPAVATIAVSTASLLIPNAL